jgi:hypothetical protein
MVLLENKTGDRDVARSYAPMWYYFALIPKILPAAVEKLAFRQNTSLQATKTPGQNRPEKLHRLHSFPTLYKLSTPCTPFQRAA